jgi:hypothetical protein
MRKEHYFGVFALLLGAWLSGCSSTSPARLCDAPLVPVNSLAPPASHNSVAHGGIDHE